MSQTVTIPKSTLDDVLKRLERLEKIVLNNDVDKAIGIYKDEKQKKKLKKLKNIDDLFT